MRVFGLTYLKLFIDINTCENFIFLELMKTNSDVLSLFS